MFVFLKQDIEHHLKVIIEYTHEGDMAMFKMNNPPASSLSNIYFIATLDKHLPLRATERLGQIFRKAVSKMTFSLLFGGLPGGCTTLICLKAKKAQSILVI